MGQDVVVAVVVADVVVDADDGLDGGDSDENDCACRDWSAAARASQSLVSSMVAAAADVVVVVAGVRGRSRAHEPPEACREGDSADSEEYDHRTSHHQHQRGD